jgi:multidrug efflux pump subunit AcrA (membrane-fusion protein)
MRVSGSVTRAGASTGETGPVTVTSQETKEIRSNVRGTILKILAREKQEILYEDLLLIIRKD